jgi:hypothetical protein
VSARVESQAIQKLFGYGESNPELPRSNNESETERVQPLKSDFSSFLLELRFPILLKLEIPALLKLKSPVFRTGDCQFFSVADSGEKPVRGGNVSRYTISDPSLFVLFVIYNQ